RDAEFIVRLPAANGLTEIFEPKPPALVDAGERACRRRILIVDDNQDAAELMGASLELMGHTIRVAYDGPEALQVVADFTPEIALVDIGLPVMDGHELARRL